MFTSLRQRLAVLVLLPVAIFLTAAGILGFVYIRVKLLDQWQEASLLKLERASHFIEMRLTRPLDQIQMVLSGASPGDGILVFFDPLRGELDKSIDRSVRCAFAMQRA